MFSLQHKDARTAQIHPGCHISSVTYPEESKCAMSSNDARELINLGYVSTATLSVMLAEPDTWLASTLAKCNPQSRKVIGRAAIYTCAELACV